jgi:hypothetical protein
MKQPKPPKISDKCIVLPFQPIPGKPFDGVGLALHFLLGNVLVLHGGLKELWFGWRVKKLFDDAQALSAYCRGKGKPMVPSEHNTQQNVRFWVYGHYGSGEVRAHIFDAANPQAGLSDDLPISVSDHLVAFRQVFIRLFDRTGLQFSDTQQKAALWKEKISIGGLDAVGRSLELFYRFSAFPQDEPLDPKPFEHAVEQAPDSFMSHDLMGWAHYRRNDYAHANRSFRQALSIHPNGAGVMSGLMWCGVFTRSWEETSYWAARKADVCEEDVAEAKEKARQRFEKHAK